LPKRNASAGTAPIARVGFEPYIGQDNTIIGRHFAAAEALNTLED
jgi:hypothetical protein